MDKFLVLGHRGYRAKYVENTIESFKKAIEYGADGIEYDARLTRDEVLVVLHDDTINGIKLRDINYEELKNIKLKNNQTVPTVEEVIKSLSDNVFLNLEIKEVQASFLSYNITKRYNALDRTLFSSFQVNALRELRKIDKNVKIGLLVEYETLNSIEDLHKELKLDSLNLWIDALKEDIESSKNFLKKWKNLGLKTFLWTLNDPEDLHTFESLYDAVITDEVELIVKEKRKMNG
ncbi:glycerophosphodiester phosphodiesterase family protein [Petrotoga sp. 9PWA.NaAc.5.4]|uniref:glycerophosphodiester phosphodiesterase family protein n=1 Tax=Petrotoga sp. 9PWA.NaAc.5.4 TaxID=1434328 RepID=UPI000CB5ABC2|nr:glycerophosphodiester phosphodiesterase family protein [Petrotoga sp. 9PWA.NaAc.5.4]PNR93682.1 glycerophosphodiester phosphodiesterase [Petrotoga sp. 9PWA.NaAc.5.4]